MMRFSMTLLGLFCIGMMQAQLTIEKEVVSDGGGYLVQGDMSMEFTLGEFATSHFANGDFELIAGFHQPTLMVTALGEYELDVQVDVYPNPTSEYVHLNFKDGLDSDSHLNLIDSRGRIIWTKEVPSSVQQVLQVDMGSYAPGAYMIELVSREGRASWRIVKRN